jgi:hypothetical protein
VITPPSALQRVQRAGAGAAHLGQPIAARVAAAIEEFGAGEDAAMSLAQGAFAALQAIDDDPPTDLEPVRSVFSAVISIWMTHRYNDATDAELAPGNVTNEVDRDIIGPAQALGYKLGELRSPPTSRLAAAKSSPFTRATPRRPLGAAATSGRGRHPEYAARPSATARGDGGQKPMIFHSSNYRIHPSFLSRPGTEQTYGEVGLTRARRCARGRRRGASVALVALTLLACSPPKDPGEPEVGSTEGETSPGGTTIADEAAGLTGESTGAGSTTAGSLGSDDPGSTGTGGEKGCAPPETAGDPDGLACRCGPEHRQGGECTREYRPVCGLYADASARTFPNRCSACSDEQVHSYFEGPCPSDRGE